MLVLTGHRRIQAGVRGVEFFVSPVGCIYEVRDFILQEKNLCRRFKEYYIVMFNAQLFSNSNTDAIDHFTFNVLSM